MSKVDWPISSSESHSVSYLLWKWREVPSWGIGFPPAVEICRSRIRQAPEHGAFWPDLAPSIPPPVSTSMKVCMPPAASLGSFPEVAWWLLVLPQATQLQKSTLVFIAF